MLISSYFSFFVIFNCLIDLNSRKKLIFKPKILKQGVTRLREQRSENWVRLKKGKTRTLLLATTRPMTVEAMIRVHLKFDVSLSSTCWDRQLWRIASCSWLIQRLTTSCSCSVWMVHNSTIWLATWPIKASTQEDESVQVSCKYWQTYSVRGTTWCQVAKSWTFWCIVLICCSENQSWLRQCLWRLSVCQGSV